MARVRIAVIGDAFVDVVAGTIAPDQLPKWGGDTEVFRPIELQPGGSALNTATHLAAHGDAVAVTLHTVVGADAFGDVLRKHLADRNVALSSPSLEGVPTGVCIVLSGTVRRMGFDGCA
jgi:sugar/nucleoside kinase (ribokinase family)